MAAPVPPRGGAEVQEEDRPHHLHHQPPGPPGPVGPVGLAGPPGPPPAGVTLLAQMVAAMQAPAAGLPAPGPGPAPPPPRVKISPPIFKGLPGERPEAHLLRANDWVDTFCILPVNKPANFKHTLDHLAREWYDSLTFPIAWNDLQQRFSRYFSTQGSREWYDSLTFPIAWNDLQQRFSRYFSTQGRSIKHLHDKWQNFSFAPGQDDIEAYIRDVKEAAHQLNYNDTAVLHLIKATMPSEIYGTLYNQYDLNTVITMVKDIYAKKPEPANPSTTTRGAAAPFTLIKAPNGSSKRVHFQDGESLSDRIDKLTETLYQMDMEGKPSKRPTNHTSQAPDAEEEEVDLGQEEVTLAVTMVKDGLGQKVDSEEEEEDSPVGEDSKGRKFDKSPMTKRPQVSSKVEDKDKDRCYHCHQQGHFAAEYPEKNKGQSQKFSEGKKFEDYTYAYGGAEEPQLAKATALLQAYEEALFAM